MNARSTISVAALLLAAIPAVFACSDPADAVDYGTICVPETEACPSSVELVRPGAGRNLLEFTLSAGSGHGSSNPVVRITTNEDLELPDERPRTDDGALVLFENTYSLEPGAEIDEELGAYDLTVATTLQLELLCTGSDCENRLQYLQLSEAVECIDDAICGRSETCERVYGRCAECADDSDCDRREQCDRQTGECAPLETASRIADESPERTVSAGGHLPALLLLAFGSVAVAFRRRRVLLGALLALAVFAIPVPGSADSGASMNVGAGFHVLTGESGASTGPGWGINVNQQLRWRWIGAAFELSTHSFGLEESVGTADERLDGYTIAVGPRVYLDLPIVIPQLVNERPFEGLLSVDYALWNVAENRLAGMTGLALQYHSVGPTLGLSWEWSGFKVKARTGYRHIFDWPGGVFSIDLMVGLGP